jgi:hypothetical protein
VERVPTLENSMIDGRKSRALEIEKQKIIEDRDAIKEAGVVARRR